MVSLFNKNLARNEKELWALALSAPIIQINQFRHEFLYGGKTKSTMISRCNFLERDWDIHSPKDLKSTLDWLEASGHKIEFMKKLSVLTTLSEQGCERYIALFRKDFERYEQWKIANSYKLPLRNVGIAAWDIGRYVFLCRTGAVVGLIDEKEAWIRIREMAPKAQMIFSGWEEYILSYFAGRQYWLGNSTVDFAKEMKSVIAHLLVYEDSILRNLDWETSL